MGRPVTNNGPAAASNIAASLSLSWAGNTIVSAAASQGPCTITAPTVTSGLGTLANGVSAIIIITVEPNATGTITATATVSATEADPTSANNTAAQSTTITNGHGCTVTGTPGNDHIYAGAGDDRTYGEDLLEGLLGLIFDNGNDTIDGGPGNDILDGQNGDDTLSDVDGTRHAERL